MVRPTLPLPPGPKAYLLPKAAAFQTQPIEAFGALWREYGDLVRLPIMPGYTIDLAVHPNAIEQVLARKDDRYPKPKLLLNAMGLLQGQGLFTSEGESWYRHRRLMQPAFQQNQMVNLQAKIQDQVRSLIQAWEFKPDGEVIDIAAEMTRLTLKIISSALFSVDLSDESNELGQAIRIGFEYVYFRMSTPIVLPPNFPTPRNRQFRQAKQTIDQSIQAMIQARRDGASSAEDLLSMLLAAQDAETGQGMSDQQVQDEAITLMNAGFETTATALSWFWYLLGTHPAVMAQIESEVESVLHGQLLSFAQLGQLPYTRRAFDESLRVHPPGLGMMRTAIADDEVQGYWLPKGTQILLGTYFTQRHPAFWRNPDRFDPDHFLPEQVADRPKYAYVPFGAGPHVCIGKNLALMESMMIITAIVQRFQIELIPQQQITVDPRFTLRPRDGVKVKLRKRSD
jgi:cytochrome P450